MSLRTDILHDPVLSLARQEFPVLRDDWTVGRALGEIRERGVDCAIIYFYTINEQNQLTGVVPVRRLLTSPLETPVRGIMIEKVHTLPESATVMQASEELVARKLLALPVVDGDGRILGVVDLSSLTEAAVDVAEREHMDEIFEAIGIRLSRLKDASPARAFRIRFPWLLATIASGTLCALLAGAFELTLAKSLVLAFFLTLVLGLGESVSIQSMTVAIQGLRGGKPNFAWYLRNLRRELATAAMLGLACGTVVGLIVWLWRGEGLAAITIGSSIVLALGTASLFGLSVPTGLHALKLDPKIAAGPITLALTDIFTLLFYFSLATWWL